MDLPKTFTIYLKTKGASKVTIKNYLSDLTHFLSWMELYLLSQNLPFSLQDEPALLNRYLKQNLVEKYKEYLLSNHLPFSTVNRRLSSLRTFAKFCLSQAWIKENPTKQLSNLPCRQGRYSNRVAEEENKIIGEFRKSLEKQKNSPNTIKNYLSDIREFLNFVRVT